MRAAAIVIWSALVASAAAELCTPGTTWKKDCNTCMCTDGGVAACTLKGCLHIADLVPEDGPKTHQGDCTPGTTWKQDCNTCTCTDGGVAACTLRGCLNDGNPGPGDGPGTQGGCTPDTTWKQDCNTCRCGRDGQAKCTEMRCIGKRSIGYRPHELPSSVFPEPGCRPGDVWRSGCLSCRCDEDGRNKCIRWPHCNSRGNSPGNSCRAQCRLSDARCLAECSLRLRTPAEVQTVSVPDSDSTTSSTSTNTISRRPESCSPGTTWQHDCNTCRCTSTGVAMCTLKGCLNVGKITAPQTERCNRPGAVWKQGCNTCRCIGNRIACTRMWCPPHTLSTSTPEPEVVEA